MAQSILYYPTIDIQDGAWLRNALLYWDNISSIVPYKNYSDFSPELLFLQECGIYRPIFPQNIFYSEYASDFVGAIVNKLDRYKRSIELSEKRFSNRTTVRIHRNKIYAPALLELIHYRKIPSDLLEYLSDSHFIKDYNCGGWIEIDARVASIYMRTLAEYAIKCNSDDIVIGTDRCKYQDDFYNRTNPRNNSACISLALNDCLPQPSMEVGIEELLDFKSGHKQELAEFRNKLREFEKVLSECSQFETEKFKEAWESVLAGEKKILTNKRVPFTLGTLYALVNIPATAEPINNALQKIHPSLNTPIVFGALLGGTAAISLSYKFVNYRNRVNERRSSSGFSYLIKASRSDIITSL